MPRKVWGGWKGGHAWLEWDGLTIDISGDQFGWHPFIVTRSPKYHGRGDPEARHSVINLHTADWFLANCGRFWSSIGEHLPRG
jgi:hypothetical protein